MKHFSIQKLLPSVLLCALLAACGDRTNVPAQPRSATAAAAEPVAKTQDCEARRERYDQDQGGRIVGGEPAKPGSAPWQVEFLAPLIDQALGA